MMVKATKLKLSMQIEWYFLSASRLQNYSQT